MTLRRLPLAVMIGLLVCLVASPAWTSEKWSTPAMAGTGSARPAEFGRDDPPPNDLCEGAYVIECGDISLSGSTQWAFNDYDLGYGNPCTGWMAMGYDVAYQFTVAAGAVIEVTYSTTADGTFYIMTDCNDVNSCVVGADEFGYPGAPETINYAFTAGGTYYLILDAYSPDEWGEWTLTGTLGCPSGVDGATWGTIKAIYR